jgi:hypothetical protein
MEQILQRVSGSEMFSLLDGFSIYNEVLVIEEDRLKTTFCTKWGTFSYKRMPFRLINVRATFHIETDVVFQGFINHSIVVYLDDVIVYSKYRANHLTHLTQIFKRCRKYGSSLNPKYSVFLVTKGNLISHIISKEDITIHPECVKVI